MSKVLIVYFSGTGCTQLVIENIEKSLIEKGSTVEVFPLDLSKVKSLSDANEKISNFDRLVIAYPVYSYDAPAPVYKWIDTLPMQNGKKTSVLSVSAGGEAFSNRTARQHIIRKLMQKNLNVDYEKMITMPSNFAGNAGERVNIMLVKAAHITAEKIAEDITQEVVLRDRKKFAVGPPLASLGFKIFVRDFGKTLQRNDRCTDCNWCEENCPTNNIKIQNGKIVTSGQCALCMRCIYGCPENAIYSKKYDFSTIKEGFSIGELAKKADDTADISMSDIKAGRAWNGTVAYLKEIF